MKLSNINDWTPLQAITYGTGKDYFGGKTLKSEPIPLNDLEPIEIQISAATPHNFFSRGTISVPPPPSGSHGLMGGNYGAQLSPRHKEFFGGDFGK
jgi:hypothetical protein